MMQINLSFKELEILTKLTNGYFKSLDAQKSQKADWAKKLSEKLTKSAGEAYTLITDVSNLK